VATELVSGLLTRLGRLLRDESQDIYTEALLTEALQLALDQLTIQLGHWEAVPWVVRTALTTTSGTALYDVGTPPAAERIVRIEKATLLRDDVERPLQVVTFGQQFHDGLTSPGEPQAVYLRANQLGVRPVPDATYTIYVYHASMGADIVGGTTTIIFPRSVRPLVMLEAGVIAASWVGDNRAAQALTAQRERQRADVDWLVMKQRTAAQAGAGPDGIWMLL